MHDSAETVFERVLWQTGPGTRRSRPRKRCRPRDNRPENALYRDGVTAGQPVSRDVIRARFAAFVRRALVSARDRGMTDREIAKRTGLAPSTFHRWQRGQGREMPEVEKVRAFCEGTGASIDEAMAALGMSERRNYRSPEPPMPPELRVIMRRLADPNVAASEKLVIREMLKMLAERAERRRPLEEETI